MKTSTVKLSAPMAETLDPSECLPRHVALTLDAKQGHGFKRLFKGLDETNARLAGGRRVASKADVLRWLLEQFSMAADAPKPKGKKS